MKLRFKYPNIIDLLMFSATFHMDRDTHCNRWMLFWNLVGARNHKPSKYECCICGVPLRKRGNVKNRVCLKDSHQYQREVKLGLRLPALYVNVEAAY